MGRYSTGVQTYDSALQISLKKLKQWGYLEPNKIKSGTLHWSNQWGEVGSISIKVDTTAEPFVLTLDYKYKDTPRKYRINIIWVLSNLGFGKVYYFICPYTFKKCRKLYNIDGYFLHRTAFDGVMYESQIRSKNYRDLANLFGINSNPYKKLNSKYFKKYYAGKPTKRYKKILAEIEKENSFSVVEFNSAMNKLFKCKK